MVRATRYGVILAACVAAAAAGVFVSYRALPETEAKGRMRPFIAEVIERHFGPDGRLAPLPGGIDYVTIARKSDGSQVRFLPVHEPDGSFTLVRSIFDVSGKRTNVLPSTKSVMTYYISPVHVGRRLARFESCPSAAEDPRAQRSSRLGYEVVHVDTSRTDPRGTEEDSQWVAPALNCFALAETHTSETGARNEDEAISVFEGEPPDSWFTAPQGYTERSPSQVAAAYAARFPGQAFMSDQFLPLADRKYSLHRRPQH
jgi:hypothetical protein